MPQSNRHMSIFAVSWCKDNKSCPIVQPFDDFSIDDYDLLRREGAAHIGAFYFISFLVILQP